MGTLLFLLQFFLEYSAVVFLSSREVQNIDYHRERWHGSYPDSGNDLVNFFIKQLFHESALDMR